MTINDALPEFRLALVVRELVAGGSRDGGLASSVGTLFETRSK